MDGYDKYIDWIYDSIMREIHSEKVDAIFMIWRIHLCFKRAVTYSMESVLTTSFLLM